MNAAAVRRDLHRHAFAHAAEALQQIGAIVLEIPGDDAVRAGLGEQYADEVDDVQKKKKKRPSGT